MIVIGADTHKRTHTCAAVFAQTGQFAGELTASAREPGFRELLTWGRNLDEERIWALEDCRPETLPAARLDESAMQVKFLLDHREDLVKARSEDQCRLRWHLHDLWPELEIPAGALDRMVWLDRVARKLARIEQGARVRVARELVTEIRRRTRRAAELEREIEALVKAQAPALLELQGCGALTAAKLIAENCAPSPHCRHPGTLPCPSPRVPRQKQARARPESKPCVASSATSRAESGGF